MEGPKTKMEDIRAEQQEENTALNSSFASEEGDEMPPTPAKAKEPPTATANRRSSIYTSDIDNSDLFTTTHGVLHAIDSTGERQPMHVWLIDIKLWTIAVELIRTRSKDSYDTFEFTPFSSAQNWDKIHPELKIVGYIQPKSTTIMKNNPKESGNVDVGYTYIWMRLTKANNFLSNVLLFFFIVMISMTVTLHYVVNTYGPNYYAFDGSLSKADHLDMCPTLSTDTLKDLIVDASMTPLETKSQTEKHGAAIVEDILTKETATQLREWTLKANQVLESTFVINNENRYHITPSHKEPAVQAALKEIASHPTFRPLLDSVMGPSASLVSMSIITNLYGAEAQFFHPDTSGSSATHPDHFVSEYTLAIPLQDTTRDMGATTICPGTHKCSGLESSEDHYHKFMQEVYPDYDDEGYPILLDDEEFKEWLEYNYCDLSAEFSAGSGLLYNSDLIHRGGGHVDPDAPERSVLFITFAESRKGKDDDRVFPVGTVHCLSYDSWGHTVDDLESVDTQSWRLWHSFGLFLPSRHSSSGSNGNGVIIRPWTLQDCFWQIFVADDAAHVFGNNFTQIYLEDVLDKLLVYVQLAGMVVLLASFLIQLYYYVKIENDKTMKVKRE